MTVKRIMDLVLNDLAIEAYRIYLLPGTAHSLIPNTSASRPQIYIYVSVYPYGMLVFHLVLFMECGDCEKSALQEHGGGC